MAWLNGVSTIYCRYCGNKGHNRRTCPQRSPEDKAKDKKRGTRECSWCLKSGHNVSTCLAKKEAFKFWVDATKVHRRKVFDAMNNIGLTPGALVVLNSPVYTDMNGNYINYAKKKLSEIPNHYVMMVDKIKWEWCFAPIPKPGKQLWKNRASVTRSYSRQFVQMTSLIPRKDLSDVTFDYIEEIFVDPLNDVNYPRFQVKLPGAQLVWENLPEDWRNGISGTEAIWALNK